MIGNYLVWEALAGGALIGLASVMLFILSGRIAGISGIAGGLMSGKLSGSGWRAAFIIGLIAGGLLCPLLLGKALDVDMQSPWWMTLLAGLLVGFGSRLGNGCTSGHGVCGLARFSRRSAAATATFMAVAFLTVYLVRHVFDLV